MAQSFWRRWHFLLLSTRDGIWPYKTGSGSGESAPSVHQCERPRVNWRRLHARELADVVAAWHGHTERMTQAVYGRVTDERLITAASGFLCPDRTKLGHN